MDSYATLAYGYKLPKPDHAGTPSWLSGDDEWENFYLQKKAPDITALTPTSDEVAEWSRDVNADKNKAKHRKYAEAKRAWFKENPPPCVLEPIGSYDSGESFVVLCEGGQQLKTTTEWAELEITADQLMEIMARAVHRAEDDKKVIDQFVRDLGLTPPDTKPGWYLIPFMSY